MPFDKPWDDDVAPVAVSFESDAVTEPERRPQASGPRPQVSSARVARVVAWLFDAAIVLGVSAWNVYLAGRICRTRYWLDFVRGAAPALIGMIGLFAVAYSWVFVALGGRTPGMALAGLRVRTLQGDEPTPAEALMRAALSLPSAALGMFGFLLALFDRRGQTLHDKLCRCVIRID